MEGTRVTTKGASDFNEWVTAVWRFLRSLTITAIGVTLIYIICRWMIYYNWLGLCLFKKPNLGCSYTRAKWFLDFSKNHFEMSIS